VGDVAKLFIGVKFKATTLIELLYMYSVMYSFVLSQSISRVKYITISDLSQVIIKRVQ